MITIYEELRPINSYVLNKLRLKVNFKELEFKFSNSIFYYNNFINFQILIKLKNVLCYNDFCNDVFLNFYFYFCAIVAFVC